jgi:hypothetical protein
MTPPGQDVEEPAAPEPKKRYVGVRLHPIAYKAIKERGKRTGVGRRRTTSLIVRAMLAYAEQHMPDAYLKEFAVKDHRERVATSRYYGTRQHQGKIQPTRRQP